jgi:ABC-type maltose transport system permease subunit
MRYRSGWGWLAVAPAFVALGLSYVWPSIWTLITSFQRKNGFTPARWTGFDNYSAVFGDFLRSLGFPLSLAVFALLGVLVVAPLLALAADAAGRRFRLGLRAALALPMLWVAPAALGLSWLLWDVQHRLPPSPDALVRQMSWAATFGVATGAAATFYLSALRRRADGRRDWWAMPLLGVLGVLTVLALSLQAFTFPLLIGAANRTRTPVGLVYQRAFFALQLGPGAAADVLLLILLAVLGLAATAVIVFTRLRVEFEPRPATAAGHAAAGPFAQPQPPAPASNRTSLVGVLGTIGGLLLLLAAAGYGLWPWLHAVGTPGGLVGHDAFSQAGIRVQVNTWLPTLITAIVSVAVAALGGYGIGWLRPLGARSELLLLPFGIWLFVGLAPLTEGQYFIHRGLHLVNNFGGLIPPVLVSIPVLFICTLFFRGQRIRSATEGGSGGGPVGATPLLLRGLPLVGLAFMATWIGYANSAVWPYLVAQSPSNLPAPVYLLQHSAEFSLSPRQPVDVASPPVLVLLIAIGLALAQIFYLDRLSVRAAPEPGAPLQPAGPAAPPGPPYGVPQQAPPWGAQPGAVPQQAPPWGAQPGAAPAPLAPPKTTSWGAPPAAPPPAAPASPATGNPWSTPPSRRDETTEWPPEHP